MYSFLLPKLFLKHLYAAFPVAFLAISLLIVSGGCEDLLPEYKAPENIFASNIEHIDAVQDTVEFSEPPDGSGGAVATYAPFYIICSITNTYEETFQYEINPKGIFEMWLPGNNTITSSVSVTVTDIIPSSTFNVSTRVLTLNPNQSIYFKVRVEPKLSSGFYIHKYAAEHSTTIFTSRYYVLKTYEPLAMRGRFSLQLTPSLPAIIGEGDFTINLKGRFPFSP